MLTLLLAAALGPFFPQTWDGPICGAAEQEIQGRCSEGLTWDEPADLTKIDGFQIFRRVVGGDGVWRLVGYLPCAAAFCAEDGSCYPRRCLTSWAPAKDSPTPPVLGALYEYTVRSVFQLNVGNYSEATPRYRGIALDCWDVDRWVPCFAGDRAREDN